MGTMLRHLIVNALLLSSVFLSFSNNILVRGALVTTLKPSENFVVTTTRTQDVDTTDHIPTNTHPTVHLNDTNVTIKSNNKHTQDLGKPEIYSFRIQSDIRYRYSRTYVTSRVANKNTEKAQEVTFRVVLPETAFISKFLMEIDGKTYEAYVKEKDEAKNIYTQAQNQGQSAGLVEINTRNKNIFNVNVNIQAMSKVTFNLTYEELLQRRLGHYEHSINISPEQFTNVKDFKTLVNIEESQNITLLRVPQLRNDVEAQEDAEGNNKDAIIERPAGNKVNISWSPSPADQKALAKQGISGKFVVQYDIQRELDAGQVLVMNGYFVHFFAPANLPPLRKHVVFILDISGSMWGRKIEQLKEAMTKILADLTTDDFFNMITFSSDVTLWSPNDKVQQEATSHWSPPAFLDGNSRPQVLSDATKKQPFAATKENIEKAQKWISALVASGGTNIHDSIVTALNLTSFIKNARKAHVTNVSVETTTLTSLNLNETAVNGSSTEIKETVPPPTILPNGVESLIIFLTDGEPTVGVTNPNQIQSLIQAANKNHSIPLFSLAFGDGADFPFVRKLSLQNNGFARKIYEATDAALQLKGFYNEIASPLLSNVTFNYTSPEFEVGNLTLTRFATVFGGTEIAVCGTLHPTPPHLNDTTTVSINGTETEQVNKTTSPTTSEATTTIPRLQDSLALPKTGQDEFILTKAYNFDVQVNGYGREGAIQLMNPEIFSSPIPWGVPVLTPWPPRPTPAPTQEDTFLEKMWAYLTIRQLIDQDLATIEKENSVTVDDYDQLMSNSGEVSKTTTESSIKNSTLNGTISGPTGVNTTVIKETPKQKALRLALKYGFVTPLTSLVVVKPNKTDVTNTVPSDKKPVVLDSMSAPQSMAHYAFVRPLHKTTPVKFLATGNRISGGGANFALLPLSIQSTRPLGYPGTPSVAFAMSSVYRPPVSFIQASEERESSYIIPTTDYGTSGESLSAATTRVPPTTTVQPKKTTVKIVSTTTSSPVVVLKLQDLSWYNESNPEIYLNETTVLRIAVNETTKELSSYIEGNACQIRTKDEGTCRHLRDCIQTEFLHDLQLFKSSYLCPIKGSSSTEVSYAGVCCPTRTNTKK